MKTFNRTSIKHLRLAHWLSQSAFARKAGISRQLVFNLERGINNPDIATITKIADVFGVAMDYFFDNNNASKNSSKVSNDE